MQTATETEPIEPSALLKEVEKRLESNFKRPVTVQGEVVETRTNAHGYVTLTLRDSSRSRNQRARLEVSLGPWLVPKTAREAMREHAVVQVTGKVTMWVDRALVQLLASSVLRTGNSETQATYEATKAAVAAGRFRSETPPLPSLVRRVLLVAPPGTSHGDLTKDLDTLGLDGWEPSVVLHPIPGDSPDIGQALLAGVQNHPDIDIAVLGRGGNIESISGWDSEQLLAAIYEVQATHHLPVLAAVGHADHRPLVYAVAGYENRHMAEAGQRLAKHNHDNATRITALRPDANAAMTGLLHQATADAESAASSLYTALEAQLRNRQHEVDKTTSQLRDSLQASLGRATDRHTGARHNLQAALERQLHHQAYALTEAATDLTPALRNRLEERARRLEVTRATLQGFSTGLALISAEHGGLARISVGERVRIDVATATAIATIDTVTPHHP